MSGKQVSDMERLARAVVAISADTEHVTERGRLLKCEGHTPLEALLIAIDETVLRRILSFHIENQGTLVVDVAERRILSIEQMAFATDPSWACMVGNSLSEDDAAQVYAFLSGFCEAASEIFVVSALTQKSVSSEFRGLAVYKLFELQRAELKELPEWLSHALVDARGLSRAVVLVRGTEIISSWGDDAFIDGLHRFSLARDPSEGTGSKLQLWQGLMADGCAVLSLESGSYRVGCVVDEAEISAAFSLWRRTMQG